MGMRLVAAVAVLVSAAVHLLLWFDGVRDDDLIGPAFLLNAVGGAVIAVALLTWRSWVPPALAVGFGLSTLAAFVVSATVGLFGFDSTWEGWEVWTAAVSEVVAVVAGGLALRREAAGDSGRQPQQHPAVGRAHLH
jgi:hypothetical protein